MKSESFIIGYLKGCITTTKRLLFYLILLLLKVLKNQSVFPDFLSFSLHSKRITCLSITILSMWPIEDITFLVSGCGLTCQQEISLVRR